MNVFTNLSNFQFTIAVSYNIMYLCMFNSIFNMIKFIIIGKINKPCGYCRSIERETFLQIRLNKAGMIEMIE